MPDKFLRESFITVLETPYNQPPTVVKQVWGYDQNKEATTPTGLRIEFTINKQLTDVADKATIRIYNLNQASRKLLAQRSIYLYKTSRVRTVQIQAGYQDDIGALFNGGIELVTNTKRGPDWITEITATTALAQITHNLLDKHWQSDVGVSAKVMADEMFEKSGQGKPIYSDRAKQILTSKKISSFFATGSAYESVRRLIRSVGLVFTTDVNGTVVVEPGNPLNANEEEAIVISEATGLVGSPRINDMGYEFKTLIDQRMIMGQLIRIKSRTLSESTPGLDVLATVWTMTVNGNTHDNEWHMDIKALFFPPITEPGLNMGLQAAIQGDISK